MAQGQPQHLPGEAARTAAGEQEPAAPREDLLDLAAVRTLRHGGAVHIPPPECMPAGAQAAAVLRY